jgi:nitrilase
VTSFKVAAVQATPIVLDREATISKAADLIAEASAAGAKIIAFPEVFVPAYPDWVWAVPPGKQDLLGKLYGELVDQAVEVPSAATRRIGEAAKAARAYVVIGVNERNASGSNSSLYNSLLYFAPTGELLGCHRKLVPTGAERLVWSQGDGSTLHVFETPLGRLGGLICWENYMPLARYAMYAWGTQIYVAATWDRGEPWLSTLRHIAAEGRMYVIGCCMPMRTADIPQRLGLGDYYPDRDWINDGDSAIVDPEGNFIAGPLHKAEGILYAELDPAQMRGPKWMLDVAGHYARPDVFQLTVSRATHEFIRSEGGAAAPNTLHVHPMGAARHGQVGQQDVANPLVGNGQNVTFVESGAGSVAPEHG